MDSLLANYASSDEEDERSQKQNLRSSPPKPREQVEEDLVPKSGGFLSSVPPPKSSSSPFSSLPPPKSHTPISSTSVPPNPKKLNKEEEERHSQRNLEDSGLSTSLPKPSSSLFSSLPQPKSLPPSSLFSSLPAPKIHNSEPQIISHSTSFSSAPASRKIVQFRPPTIPTHVDNEDEDDEDEVEMDKQKKRSESLVQTSSVKSFLSSIPKPKNSKTLGALPSASGIGRRSILEADVPGSNDSNVANAGTGSEAGVDVGYFESKSVDNQVSVSSMSSARGSSEYVAIGDYSNWGSGSENYVSYDGYTGYDNSGVSSETYSNWGGGTGDYANYGNEYGSYASYGQYESNWGDGQTTSMAPQLSGSAESVLRVPGKRGRNDGPQEIVEVKQDELMKNRPREDQVKLTGIAFGPAYQPTSTKGKPSKLHKRKHQIGSLYHDMKQKEMELAERRARGFLTKAQTQGKYGW